MVATRTRSSSSGSTPASSSARRPASVASASRRSPSATWRRSRTPVRATIQSSLTPARSAISALPTIRSGSAAPMPCMALRMGLDPLKAAANEAGEHLARAHLHEPPRAATREGPHDLEPADRVGDRLRQPLANVVERLRRDAGQDRHARLAHLDLIEQLAEGLDDALHRGRVEGALYGQAPGAEAALLELRCGLVDIG